MVFQKQKEGAGTCRFSVDLQNGKTIRIPLIWYKRRLIAKLEKSGIDLKDGILNEDFDELRPHPDDD